MMAIRTCPGSGPAAPAAASAGPEAAGPEAAGPEAACPARNGGVEMPVTRYRRDGSGSDSSHGAEPSGVVSTPDPLPEPSSSSSPSCALMRPYQ